MNRASSSLFRAHVRSVRQQARENWARFCQAMFSWRTLISVVGLALIAALFSVAITPVRYDLSVGMVPTHTITANRDMVDEITTEALRNAAAQSVQPAYVMVEGVQDTVLSQLTQIYNQMDATVQYSETLEDYGPNRRYSAEELEYARTILTMLSLRDYQLRTLLNTPRDELADMYSVLYEAVQNAMSGYIIEGSEYTAVSSILQIVGYRVETSLLQNVVQPLLNDVIQPNIVIDQEATEAAREQARQDVEPVVYKQGQNIVVKGEGRVERYQYEMLSNMGLLSNTTIDLTIYVGAVLLVLLTLSGALALLRAFRKEIVHDIKRLLLLFIILILSLIFCVVARFFNIYLAPVALTALLLGTMLGLHAAVIFNVAMAILAAALAVSGSTGYTTEMFQLLACYLCSGGVSALLIYRKSSRIRVICAGILAGVINFALVFALGLMTGSSLDTVLLGALWMLAGGAIAGVLCVALQPLLELIFNLPTPTKLMELSNPNHPLLHRLLLEAPGTYHHSIVVSNLAEAAAEAIGANPLLARVGGYYHDIGKLRRPSFFKENQLGGENKLAETDPYTAAQIVISHTRDGATLARNYHLPREVIRIIQEHHGNTPTMYFYTMALKEANGKPVDVADFRYDANPPSTKEGAIVLLCDTIEAAVRSMQNPTPEAIESFIIRLIHGKLQDGQLSNSPLTLKDIDDICHACTTVLNGVFHERIEYPDPPAQLQKQPAAAEEAPAAPGTSADPSLTKPWDGFTPEASEPADYEPHKPVSLEDDTDSLLSQPQQIPIDPSDFEEDQPLPLVEMPEVGAIPSVAEVMESLPEDTPGEKADPDTEDSESKEAED